MNADEFVRRRSGKWSGDQALVRCPVKGHGRGRGDLNPSLSIAKGKHQAIVVHCFAGCDPRDVLRALGGDAPTADARPRSSSPSTLWRTAWEEGRPAIDNLAATYLCEHRRVARASNLPGYADALRFHPSAPFSNEGSWRVPGLMAAVQDADGRMIGLQVTGLRQDGRGKILTRKVRHTFGRISGGAVRLGQPGPGRRPLALAVAEGVETALGFAKLSGYACWASLGASLGNFRPPLELDELVIAADHDDAGLKLARRLAKGLAAARPSLFIEIRHPAALGHDWADEAQAASGNG